MDPIVSPAPDPALMPFLEASDAGVADQLLADASCRRDGQRRRRRVVRRDVIPGCRAVLDAAPRGGESGRPAAVDEPRHGDSDVRCGLDRRPQPRDRPGDRRHQRPSRGDRGRYPWRAVREDPMIVEVGHVGRPQGLERPRESRGAECQRPSRPHRGAEPAPLRSGDRPMAHPLGQQQGRQPGRGDDRRVR